ncbi:rab-like protein 6 [Glandiceps talaboti]
MFSALKKLVGTDAQNKGTVPCGMQAMGQNLQKKFAKGVQYNMKIIIKGDRNTGKTTLFHRLQGQKFIEDYIATQEIQVASIQWNYKNTDDIVKVEVWDVVDKGKSRKKHDGLKVENDPDAKANSREPCLDAEFLDVYKGTHGVVMMMDITKQWTYDYIQRELPKIPNHIPVLVLANFADMGEHRVVSRDEIKYFVEHFERPVGSTIVRFAESSMKNGFGLKFLHQFFNVPFLILQRETLMRQLETNRKDIDCILEELDIYADSDEQNYQVYLETLVTKQKNQAKQKAAAAAAAAAANKEESDEGKSPSQVGSNSVTPNSLTPSKLSPVPSPGTTTPTRQQQQQQPSTESSSSLQQKVSRFFSGGSSTSLPDKQSSQEQSPSLEIAVPSPGNVKGVEDFIPGDSIDSFLDDTGKSRHDSTSLDHTQHNADSDDDDAGHNPMVAGFVEDIDSEDEGVSQKDTSDVAASFHVELSSDEDDDSPFVAQNQKVDEERDSKKKRSPTQITAKTLDKIGKLSLEPVNSAICNDSVNSIPDNKVRRNRKSTTEGSDDMTQSDDDDDDDVHNNQVSMVIEDPDEDDEDSLKRKERKTKTSGVTVQSPALCFNSSDLDFLETHTIGSRKTSSPSTTPTTSSVASTKEGSSEEDRRSGSTKKKKHKEKDRDREKDGERSHKKHKHKKNKDRDKERDRDDSGKEKKKKKKHKKMDEEQGKDKEMEKEMDELEAFLSGGDKTPNKAGGDYEVF